MARIFSKSKNAEQSTQHALSPQHPDPIQSYYNTFVRVLNDAYGDAKDVIRHHKALDHKCSDVLDLLTSFDPEPISNAALRGIKTLVGIKEDRDAKHDAKNLIKMANTAEEFSKVVENIAKAVIDTHSGYIATIYSHPESLQQFKHYGFLHKIYSDVKHSMPLYHAKTDLAEKLANAHTKLILQHATKGELVREEGLCYKISSIINDACKDTRDIPFVRHDTDVLGFEEFTNPTTTLHSRSAVTISDLNHDIGEEDDLSTRDNISILGFEEEFDNFQAADATDPNIDSQLSIKYGDDTDVLGFEEFSRVIDIRYSDDLAT